MKAIVVLLGCLLSVAACDVEKRPGTWQPAGYTRADLARQVADPQDLIQGHGEDVSDGVLADKAVQRLHDGKTKHLIDVETSDMATGGGGGSGAGGAGGSAN